MATETETLNVLLVDDSDVARAKLADLCENIPFVRVVATASNGAEAIRYAKQAKPDLVLMDLVMPNIDGMVALRMLCGGVPGIRVAVMSSLGGSKRVAEEAFRFGAIEVLGKPVLAEDMERLCQSELARKNEQTSQAKGLARTASLKFFGQFLLERQAITLAELRSALELMERGNVPLEEVAVEQGLLSTEQAARLRTIAKHSGYSFRELVEQDAVINESGINQLLESRISNELPLDQALVRLGYLTEPRVEELTAEYETQRASLAVGPASLPGELSSYRPAHVALELIPTYLEQVAGIVASVNYVEVTEASFSDMHRVALLLRGAYPMRVELIADSQFARRLARALSNGVQDGSDPSVLSDGMLEFLNIVLGNTLTILESEGVHLSIVPPSSSDPDTEGTTLEIVAPAGRAWVCVDADPDVPDRVSELDLQIAEPAVR